MARLPYLEPRDLPEEYRSLVTPSNPFVDERTDDSGVGGDKTWDTVKSPRNTHRIFANNPKLLRAYRQYAAPLWLDTGLSQRQRELVIIAIARALPSAYEWHQHVRKALGGDILTEEEVLAVSRGALDVFDDEDATLIEYVTHFAQRTVNDEVHARAAEHFDASTIVGINLLAGYYVSIDYIGDSLALDFEEEFIGWEIENR